MYDTLEHYQLDELHLRNDAKTGLKAIIAIHNTSRGPALGGCRFLPYHSDDHALLDAARLARGMSYKAALAGLPQGGGKSVILKPPGDFDAKALFTCFGEFIESLNGRYITAIDSGTSNQEMDWIAQKTRYVTSTSQAGDPSPYTALGVFQGIKACVEKKLKRKDLQGLRVTIQGVGHVGYALGKLLAKEGAELIVADLNKSAVTRAMNECASACVDPNQIHAVECEVFAPCGLSGPINENTIEELQCQIIAGSANVQLTHHELGEMLHDQGILYAPDYVINAGGLIYASLNHSGKKRDYINAQVKNIHRTLESIFEESATSNCPPSEVADKKAQALLVTPMHAAA